MYGEFLKKVFLFESLKANMFAALMPLLKSQFILPDTTFIFKDQHITTTYIIKKGTAESFELKGRKETVTETFTRWQVIGAENCLSEEGPVCQPYNVRISKTSEIAELTLLQASDELSEFFETFPQVRTIMKKAIDDKKNVMGFDTTSLAMFQKKIDKGKDHGKAGSGWVVLPDSDFRKVTTHTHNNNSNAHTHTHSQASRVEPAMELFYFLLVSNQIYLFNSINFSFYFFLFIFFLFVVVSVGI